MFTLKRFWGKKENRESEQICETVNNIERTKYFCLSIVVKNYQKKKKTKQKKIVNNTN